MGDTAENSRTDSDQLLLHRVGQVQKLKPPGHVKSHGRYGEFVQNRLKNQIDVFLFQLLAVYGKNGCIVSGLQLFSQSGGLPGIGLLDIEKDYKGLSQIL